jgi:hypothetical protein
MAVPLDNAPGQRRFFLVNLFLLFVNPTRHRNVLQLGKTEK